MFLSVVRQECNLLEIFQTHTSVLTEEGVVADGARFGKGVEFVQPFSGDVKLQQAGFLHVGQSHHLLPLSYRLLAAFPANVQNKTKQETLTMAALSMKCVDLALQGLQMLTYRTTRRPLRSAPPSHGLQ